MSYLSDLQAATAYLIANPQKISTVAQKFGAWYDATDDLLNEFGVDLPSLPAIARDVQPVALQCEIADAETRLQTRLLALIQPHIPLERKLADGKFMEAFGKFMGSPIGQMMLSILASQLGKLGS